MLCNYVVQSGFLPGIYEGSDPNGIRTRVTAVKGRCPGPLDDRVKSAGNIEFLLSDARQIARQISFSPSLLLLLRPKIGN